VPSADQVATEVKRRLAESRSVINTYWYGGTEGNRDDFASNLAQALSSYPTVIHVLRDKFLFTNENAVGDDVMAVLEQERVAVERWPTDEEPCAVIVIARGKSKIVTASSPAVLPEWFPFGRGTECAVTFADMTWRVDGPLDSPEVRVDQLRDTLYRLDTVCLNRLEAVYGADRNATAPLLDLFRTNLAPSENQQSWDEIASQAMDARGPSISSRAFRPSRTPPLSLSGHLWCLALKTPTDGLPKCGKKFATALNLPPQLNVGYESIQTLLGRPTTPELDATRAARNLLTTWAMTCQLITTVAHADQYPAYPLNLLESVSSDLLLSLGAADSLIRSLAPM
jgi:hypothetical protein